jgi:predicted nucleic acid-binding protein
MRFLADTNVLLRWVDGGNPLHDVCLEAVRHFVKQGWDSCICAQVLIEFWAVATRPSEVNGLGLSISDAARNLTDLDDAFTCLPEPPDMAQRWREVVTQHSVSGKQAHDARLAAFMRAHDIKHLVTLNPQDFVRYAEITPLTPAEVLSL